MIVSVDIETDGPIPGKNSLLQLGLACFKDNGQLIDSIDFNIAMLIGAERDPDTMAWWKTQGDAYENTRKNLVVARDAMYGAKEFIFKCGEGPYTFVAYPLAFDWMFVRWYAEMFMGNPYPFSMSACVDIKSYAAGILGTNFRSTVKRRMPKEWFKGLPKHTHVASEDAIGQGMLYFNIKKYREDMAQEGMN